jgi:hypothetical protein
MRNGRKHRDGKSRYRGVHPLKNRWVANLWLGTFNTEEAAGLAYKNAFEKHFGHPQRHPSKGE